MSAAAPLDLNPLVELAKTIAASPAPTPLLAFVRAIELSPMICSRLKGATKGHSPALSPADYDGAKLFGIEVRQNGALPDTHAILRFADGRVGLWDMRIKEVEIIGGKA